MSQPFVLAICNQKGGVGKTTSACMIAAELAIRGYRTLIIDADPQSNTTQVFLRPDEVTCSLANVLVKRDGIELSSIISQRLSTELENLDIVPTNLQLAPFDQQGPLAITRLRRALKDLGDAYQFIVIDTPPNLGFLLTAALTASTHVLVPVEAAPFALNGLDDLQSTIRDCRDNINENLEMLGSFCTLFDARTEVSAASLEALRSLPEARTFETVIHARTKLKEAPAYHQPIQLLAPVSDSAKHYAALTDEILQRLAQPIQARTLTLVTEKQHG